MTAIWQLWWWWWFLHLRNLPRYHWRCHHILAITMKMVVRIQIIKTLIMMGSYHHTLSHIHFLHTLVMMKFVMIYFEGQCEIWSYIPLAPFKSQADFCMQVMMARMKIWYHYHVNIYHVVDNELDLSRRTLQAGAGRVKEQRRSLCSCCCNYSPLSLIRLLSLSI